jgi:hypothetical protein
MSARNNPGEEESLHEVTPFMVDMAVPSGRWNLRRQIEEARTGIAVDTYTAAV